MKLFELYAARANALYLGLADVVAHFDACIEARIVAIGARP